jgi:hypothetical protein
LSNPISTLPNTDADADADADADVNANSIDTAQPDHSEKAGVADSVEAPGREAKGRSGLIVLILGVLLVGSVAINLKQSRDVASLESANSEFEQALTAAVERIDVETARANGAEAALARVDSAVDVVNERILGLQDALDGLREATVR